MTALETVHAIELRHITKRFGKVVANDDIDLALDRGETLRHTREEVITTYQKLEEVMAQLPKTFVQCHKSFGVNLYEIRQFRAAGILLREGTQIPVSRSRNAAARAAFFALIGQSV